MNAPLPVTQPRGPGLAIDPRAYERGLSCVHCGLCLPACPTYTQNGLEADSPRGRIQLMLALADGKIEASPSVRSHLDLCLDCRGCESACPSAVVYHELLEETRARLAATETVPLQGRLMRWLFYNVFVHPSRLKLALLPARILQKIGLYALMRKVGLFKVLPAQLRKMEEMLPDNGPIWPKQLASQNAFVPKSGVAKATVGFFEGCIGSVMFGDVNRKAVEILQACGAKVIAAPAQTCCGAIHHHSGSHEPAQEMARRNIDAFLPENGPKVDFIVTTIAGCGALLHEYDVLLRDDPKYSARAAQFVARVRDISQVILELGLPPLKHSVSASATYHDACHLAHAQKVTAAPRKLLEQVPGLKMIAMTDSDMCCGAAGTYNITHPEMAASLAERKLKNIAHTGAKVCVAGNVGCAMHIQSRANAVGQELKVVHPVDVLHEAIFGRR